MEKIQRHAPPPKMTGQSGFGLLVFADAVKLPSFMRMRYMCMYRLVNNGYANSVGMGGFRPSKNDHELINGVRMRENPQNGEQGL